MKKFWNWKNQEQTETTPSKRILSINGVIAEESWYDDDVTPKLFKAELESSNSDIDLWLNTPGGDCVAAAQIYNMIKAYPGKVRVIIDGLAASAGSVVAMAGDEIIMSPVGMMMIHNPMTAAMGDASIMAHAIEMLDSVKESIINAYAMKTGLSRAKLSHLMDAETWMDANKALELGFIDSILTDEKSPVDATENTDSMLYSRKETETSLVNKLRHKMIAESAKIETPKIENNGRKIDDLYDRLNLMKH